MREYELMFIVAQTDVKEGYHEQVTEEVRAWIEAAGGRVLRVRPWGLRQLAYEIEENDHGYYVIMQLLLEPSAVRALEEKMKLHERIVRFLSVQIGEREEGDVDVLTELVEEEEVEKIASGHKQEVVDEVTKDAPEDDAAGSVDESSDLEVADTSDEDTSTEAPQKPDDTQIDEDISEQDEDGSDQDETVQED